jgi:hypothetical protein
VFLNSTEQPHITLYLTEFESAAPVVFKLGGLIGELLPVDCEPIVLANITVGGCYALWEVEPNSCLQAMSNSIVLATSPYILPNQTIPDWVKSLPEPIRSEKEAFIKKYGSPNVFSQFSPHVS